eukprot:Seg2340.9 transcript_id=Seg2340.9/GoldUCD/mRNA.D3Y31 product="hypothetical protein" protein_id=Seg2340.9/GoldUCD/D3Y31
MSREFVTNVRGSSNRYSISFSEEEPEKKEPSRLTYSADFTRSFEESYKEDDDVLIVDIDYGQDQQQSEGVDGKEADSPESLSRSGSLSNSFSKRRPKDVLRRYKSVEEVITSSPKKSKTKLHKTYSDYDYRYKGFDKKEKASAKLTMSADLSTSHEEVFEGDEDVLIVDIDYNHGNETDHSYEASMEEDARSRSSSDRYGMGNGAPRKDIFRKYKSVEDVHSEFYSDRAKDLRRTISGYELTFTNENEPDQISKLSLSADFTTSHEEKVGPVKAANTEEDDEFCDIDIEYEGRIFADHFETSTPQKSKKDNGNGDDLETKNGLETDSLDVKSVTTNGLSSVNDLHDNRKLNDDQKSTEEQADDQTSKSSPKFKIEEQGVNNQKGAVRILDLASKNQEVTLTLSPEVNASSNDLKSVAEDNELKQENIVLPNGVQVHEENVINGVEMEAERRTKVLISMKGGTLGAMEGQRTDSDVDRTDVQDKKKRSASDEGGIATENKKNRVEVTLSLTGQTKAEYPEEATKEIPVENIPDRPIDIPAEVRPKEDGKHEERNKVVREKKRVEVSLSLKGSQINDDDEEVMANDDAKTTEVVSDEAGLQLDDIIIEDKETEEVQLNKRAAAYLYFKGSHEPGDDSQQTDDSNISLFVDDIVKGDVKFEERENVEDIPEVIDEEVKVESVDQVMTMPGEEMVSNVNEANSEQIKAMDLQVEDEEPAQEIIIGEKEIDVHILESTGDERGLDKDEISIKVGNTKSDEEADLKEVETKHDKETSDKFRLTVSQGAEDAWVIVSEDEGSDNSDHEAQNDDVDTEEDGEEGQTTPESNEWKMNGPEDEGAEPEAGGAQDEEKPDEVYEDVIPQVPVMKDPEDVLVKIIVTKAESMDEDQMTGHYEVTEPLYSTVTPTKPNGGSNAEIDASDDGSDVVSQDDYSEEGEPNSEGLQLDNMVYGLVGDVHDNTTSNEGIYTEIDEVEDPNANRPKQSETQNENAQYGKPYEIILIKESPGDAEENIKSASDTKSASDMKSASRLARLGRRLKFYLIGSQKHIANNEKQKEDINETISSDTEVRYTFRLPEYISDENEHIYESFNDLSGHHDNDDNDDENIYETIDDTVPRAAGNVLFAADSKGDTSAEIVFGGLNGGAIPLTETINKVYRIISKTADRGKVKTETVRMFLGQERLVF